MRTRKRAPLVVATLAGSCLIIGMSAASDSDSDSGSDTPDGCTPEPGYHTIDGEPVEEGDRKWRVSISGGDPEAMDGSGDEGNYVEVEAEATDTGLLATLDAFVWAEDGEENGVDFEAEASRDHVFYTTCIPNEGHDVPPYGNSEHYVQARAEVKYRVRSPQNTGGRAFSADIRAELPTGRSLHVHVTSSDGSAKTHKRSIGLALEGSSSTTTEVSGGVSPSQGVQAGFSQAQQAGVNGSINFNDESTWTENSAMTMVGHLTVDDERTFKPQCAGGMIIRHEEVSIIGGIELGSDNWDMWVSDELETLTAKASAETQVTVQSFPGCPCGYYEPSTGGGTQNSQGGGSPGGQTGGSGGGGGSTGGGGSGAAPGADDSAATSGLGSIAVGVGSRYSTDPATIGTQAFASKRSTAARKRGVCTPVNCTSSPAPAKSSVPAANATCCGHGSSPRSIT